MDLVKFSPERRLALASVVALVGMVQPSRTETVLGFSVAAVSALDARAHLDAAFAITSGASPFGLSGPNVSTAPALVRGAGPVYWSAFPSTLPPLSSRVARWSAYVEEASARFGLPAAWVRAVLQAESGGRTTLNGRPITSSAGAMGLMQVMPGTFADMSARFQLGSDPHEPRANIMAGAAYLRAMFDRYGAPGFLAAYNAGPARFDAYILHGRRLPAETRAYVAALAPRVADRDGTGTLWTPRVANDGPRLDSVARTASDAPTPPPSSRPAPAVSPLFVAGNGALTVQRGAPAASSAGALIVEPTRLDARRRHASAGTERD